MTPVIVIFEIICFTFDVLRPRANEIHQSWLMVCLFLAVSITVPLQCKTIRNAENVPGMLIVICGMRFCNLNKPQKSEQVWV